MTFKTPAELQLEHLKKLKEQQRLGKAKPRPPQAPESAPKPMVLELDATPRKRKAPAKAQSLKISKAAWKRM